MSKPREFWIEQFNGRSPPTFYAHKDKPQFSKVKLKLNFDEREIDACEYFHVIEYSAFTALEAEVKELKEANDNCISLLLHENRMKAVENENKELKWFAEQMNKYVMPGENDTQDSAPMAFKKMRDEIGRLRTSLTQIIHDLKIVSSSLEPKMIDNRDFHWNGVLDEFIFQHEKVLEDK